MRYKKIKKNIKEDIIFAKRTEEAWKRYEKGEFIEMEFDYFLKNLKKQLPSLHTTKTNKNL